MTIAETVTTTDAFGRLAEPIVNGFDRATVTIPGTPERGEVTITVLVMQDTDANPFDDADAYTYTDEALAAWKAGTWRFVGLRLTVESTCVESDASIWGVERGLASPEIERAHLAESLLPDLYSEAVTWLEQAAKNLRVLGL